MENQFTNSEIKIIYSGLSRTLNNAMRDAYDIKHEISQVKLSGYTEIMPDLIMQKKDNENLLCEVCNLITKIEKEYEYYGD